MDPEMTKKLRARANRARRELLKEKEERGHVRDGAGKRYTVPVFYVLAGDVEKALEFYTWFEEEFPDDIGEPVFDLYRALAHYRAGNLSEARIRLQRAMLQNIYMLPVIFGDPIEKLDMWHGSNYMEPDYLFEVDEYLDEPTAEEREWMKAEFYSDRFRKLREGYIDTYKALLGERDIDKRREILDNWDQYAKSFFT